jgi:hypothetical protein
VAHHHTTEIDFTPPAEIGRVGNLALGIGVIGFLILAAGVATSGVESAKDLFFRSYLVALIFWVGPMIGCLGMLMLQHVITGSWGLMVRRVLEAATRTLPLVALLFVPIAVEMFTGGHLYHWVHPNGDAIILKKAPYLNPAFFWARTVIYFAFWGFLAWRLNAWSKEQDETGELAPLRKANRFSGPGIVFFAFSVTFAATDWVMSLDPHWFSTIFGLLYLINWLITAWTFVIAVMYWLRQCEPMNHVVNPRHFHDISKLMLAFTMVWAYFTLSQYLITWAGNLPEETVWYIRRGHGLWDATIKFLVVFHFAIPFLLLLSRAIKRDPKKMIGIVALMFIMRMVDMFWTIWPEVARHGEHIELKGAWTVIPALIGLGGVWVWFFTVQLRQRPLMPPRDPKLEEALTTGWHGH